MKAENLQYLITGLSLCESSLDYIVIFREFLRGVYGDKVDEMGLNKICFETILLLSDKLEIDEIIIDDMYYNVKSPIYNDSKTFKMGEYGFKLQLVEPSFDIDNIIQETSFLEGIKHLEFEDGTIMKLSDLKTESNDDSLSELDTFFNFFDMETYNKVVELINEKCLIITSNDEGETGFSDEYIIIVNSILQNFIEREDF